jgi:hypothetical protein
VACADERLATKIETINNIEITLTTATVRSKDRFDPIENLTRLTGKLNLRMTSPPNSVGICCESGRIHLGSKPRVNLSAFAFCDSSKIGH